MRPFPIPEHITVEWLKAMVLQLDPDDDEAEQQLRMELERQMAAELEKALQRQMNDLIPPTASDEQVREAPAQVTATSGPVRDALVRGLARGADLGVSIAFDQMQTIGFGFDWTLAHTKASEYASRYSYELVRGINDTTRNQLQIAVDEWFRNPDSLGALRRQLAPTFGARRATLIATTETTRAAAEGSILGYEESGVVEQVEWVTVNDERVCPQCGPLDNTRAPLRGTFTGGVRVPAHPGCRCFVRPVIEEPKAEPKAEEAPPAYTPPEQVRAQMAQIEQSIGAQVPELESNIKVLQRDIFNLNQGIEGLVRQSQGIDRDSVEWQEIFDEQRKLQRERNSLYTVATAQVNELARIQEQMRQEITPLLRAPNPAHVEAAMPAGAEPRAIGWWRDGASGFNQLVDQSVLSRDVVPVDTTTDRRAYYSYGQKTVYMTTGHGARTMVHEMGHWLEEQNPQVHQKALDFYDRRTAGEALEPLGANYRSDEKTRRDKFLDPYMGKDYGRSATEIVSMGLEFMHAEPVRFARDDPDYFDFIYHLVRGN